MAFVTILLLAPTGCSFRQLAARTMAGSFEDFQRAFDREESPAMARAAAPALLKMLDGLIESDPHNRDLLLQAAQMNAAFAFALIEEEDPAWARTLYAKARWYALTALRGHKRLRSTLARAREDEVRSAIAKLQRRDAPALFWLGQAWGSMINLDRQNPGALSDLPAVAAIMERVRELRPDYFFGGPDLFFGIFLGGRGTMLGGDPRRSRQAFEWAVARGHGRFLMARYHYARVWAVQNQDRALCERELRAIIDAPLPDPPEMRLANAVARERAAEFLKTIADHFVE